MKQEIERHLQDKETLENSLPSSIVIGPYWISTEGVRQALAKKRKALANAVIELLAKKLRKQADMVCNNLTNVDTWGTVSIILLTRPYTLYHIREGGRNGVLGYHTFIISVASLHGEWARSFTSLRQLVRRRQSCLYPRTVTHHHSLSLHFPMSRFFLSCVFLPIPTIVQLVGGNYYPFAACVQSMAMFLSYFSFGKSGALNEYFKSKLNWLSDSSSHLCRREERYLHVRG